MTYREIKKALKVDAAEILSLPEDATVNDETIYDDGCGNIEASMYLGSYMRLDPCGRYHHFLSPNGATKRCERFWDNLHRAADELGLSIGDSEGDGCDVMVTRWLRNSERGE